MPEQEVLKRKVERPKDDVENHTANNNNVEQRKTKRKQFIAGMHAWNAESKRKGKKEKKKREQKELAAASPKGLYIIFLSQQQ